MMQQQLAAQHSPFVSRVSPRATSGSHHRAVVPAASKDKYPGPFEDVGTGMLRAPKLILTDIERQRLDESPDANFYSTPRLMQHADQDTLDALTAIYAQVVPPGACALELCASAHSHLPPGLAPRLMVGQGMNSNEMAANPALHQHFLQDLNLQPLLLEQLDASYEMVLCVNGIQYLTQIETVLHEASRVLRPGGLLVVAFGPDCFREKALAGWLSRTMQERSALLQEIIAANGFDRPVVLDSPAAAAALFSLQQQQPQPPAAASNGKSAAHVAAAGANSSSSSGKEPQLQVLVAVKSQDWTAGAAEADTVPAGVDMRPDNVQAWFTKPGLAGLAEAAALQPLQHDQQQQQQSPSATPQPAAAPLNTTSSSSSSADHTPAAASTAADPRHDSLTGSAVNDRLLGQWHAAYESLVVDAVDLGIPRSVIPDVKPDATPAELQAAVQHLQDMMASFLSAGL